MKATVEPKRAAAPRRLVRDKPDDFVADWFFPVPMPAYQAAIDVERTERRKPVKGPNGEKRPSRVWYVWSRRAEPEWAFVEGDVFHAPPTAPGAWGEQARGLRWTLQLKRVLDRTVTVALLDRYRDSQAWAKLSTATRKQREEIFRPIVAEIGAKPSAVVTRKAMQASLDRRKATPFQEKKLRTLFPRRFFPKVAFLSRS